MSSFFNILLNEAIRELPTRLSFFFFNLSTTLEQCVGIITWLATNYFLARKVTPGLVLGWQERSSSRLSVDWHHATFLACSFFTTSLQWVPSIYLCSLFSKGIRNRKSFMVYLEIGNKILSQWRLMIRSRFLTIHVLRQNLTVKKNGFLQLC